MNYDVWRQLSNKLNYTNDAASLALYRYNIKHIMPAHT